MEISILWTVVLAMQAAMGPLGSARRPAPVAAPTVCPETTADDVVVCGAPDPESLRLRPLTQRYERPAGLPRAAVNIAGATLAAESEAGQAIGGAPPRAMARLKFRF